MVRTREPHPHAAPWQRRLAPSPRANGADGPETGVTQPARAGAAAPGTETTEFDGAGSLQSYLREIHRVPLFTAQQEYAIAKFDPALRLHLTRGRGRQIQLEALLELKRDRRRRGLDRDDLF